MDLDASFVCEDFSVDQLCLMSQPGEGKIIAKYRNTNSVKVYHSLSYPSEKAVLKRKKHVARSGLGYPGVYLYSLGLVCGMHDLHIHGTSTLLCATQKQPKRTYKRHENHKALTPDRTDSKPKTKQPKNKQSIAKSGGGTKPATLHIYKMKIAQKTGLSDFF